MSYVSLTFNFLDRHNIFLTDQLQGMRVNGVSALSRGCREVGIRVMAVGLAVIGLVGTLILTIPDMVLLNRAITKERGYGCSPLAKINSAYMRALSNSLGATFIAIFSPDLAYTGWRLQNNYIRALSDTLVELPRSFSKIGQAAAVDTARLPDGGRQCEGHGVWRAGVAAELTTSFVSGEVNRITGQIQGEPLASLEANPDLEANPENFQTVSYDIFVPAVRRYLQQHYSEADIRGAHREITYAPLPRPVRVRPVMPPVMVEPPAMAACAPVVPINEPGSMEMLAPPLLRARFCSYFEAMLDFTKRELIGKNIYTADDIEAQMDGSYAAMIECAIYYLLSRAEIYPDGALFINTNVGAMLLTREHNYMDLYAPLHRISQSLLELTRDQRADLLRRLHHKASEDGFFAEDPMVQRAFNAIGALRTEIVDCTLMTRVNEGIAEGEPRFDFLGRFG